MKPNVSQWFNGVELTRPCQHCKGEGESSPTEEQRGVCLGCGKKVEPLPTTTGQEWLSRNTLKCPECGACGDGEDFGLQALWCVDCEGTGRTLTVAGRELLAFIDAWRPPR